MLPTENLNAATTRDLGSFPSISEAVMALSHEGLFEKVADYITNRINDVKNYFVRTNNDLENISEKDMTVQANDINKLIYDIKKLDPSFDMRKVEHIDIPITLGLNMNLLDGSRELNNISKPIHELVFKYFDNIDTVISKILADLDYRKKITPIKEDKSVEKLNSDIRDLINKMIDPTGSNDRRSISKLVPNIKSLETIQNNLMVVNKNITYDLIKNIKSRINSISIKVDKLHTLITSDIDAGISRSTLNELAWNLDNAAEFATRISSIFYLTNQYNSMLINAVKEIKNVK